MARAIRHIDDYHLYFKWNLSPRSQDDKDDDDCLNLQSRPGLQTEKSCNNTNALYLLVLQLKQTSIMDIYHCSYLSPSPKENCNKLTHKEIKKIMLR